MLYLGGIVHGANYRGRNFGRSLEARKDLGQRADEKHERGDHSGERERLEVAWAFFGVAENAQNASTKAYAGLVAVERHGEMQVHLPLLFQTQKSRGIDGRVVAGLDGNIVAAKLALLAQVPADPPDGRVEEEKRLDHGLQ